MKKGIHFNKLKIIFLYVAWIPCQPGKMVTETSWLSHILPKPCMPLSVLATELLLSFTSKSRVLSSTAAQSNFWPSCVNWLSNYQPTNGTCTLVELNILATLNSFYAAGLALGPVLGLRHVYASCRLILWFQLQSPNQSAVSAWTELWHHL